MPSPQVALLGAGPIGVACGAHLAEADIPFTVLESGNAPATAVREWEYDRLFSPWSMNLGSRAVGLLSAYGWRPPASDEGPLIGADR